MSDAVPLGAHKLIDRADSVYESQNKVFYSLMKWKVRRVLLVSSLYDAFILESEGLISELVIGEYHHLLLSSPPRIHRVNSGRKALESLKKREYDLVITMSKNIGMDPFRFGKKIKKIHPDLPVILLATESSDLVVVEGKEKKTGIDKTFFWTGDSSLFLAIIKYVEDSKNSLEDTMNGNVRVIIMVEDSIRYYSMFLPMIYTEVVRQTQRSLSEDLNEMQMQLRRRARPRILLAENYEEAIELYEQYADHVLGIISDMNFKRKGKYDDSAGIEFVKHVKENYRYTPILLQSSVSANRTRACELGIYFLDKSSPSLMQDFEQFMLKILGFGDFIFRMPKPHGASERTIFDVGSVETIELARAGTIKEFERVLPRIPQQSITYHAKRNHFSNWLLARGEFKLATMLRPKDMTEFTDPEESRRFLIDLLQESRREKQAAVITDFSQQTFEFEGSFTRLQGDSLGGKGRGIAFIRSILARYNLSGKYPQVELTVPNSVVVGTLEFDCFVVDNGLLPMLEKYPHSDDEIKEMFLKATINEDLRTQLKRVLRHFKQPLAVRSSSLLEDSQNTPFAGMYSTYMIPNNAAEDEVRLQELCDAIKLVYASVFFEEPTKYVETTASVVEEEKMAVLIQEVVGSEHEDLFYPTFSGVAQSFNFYPIGHQKSEEGIVCVAAGLGKSVVGGARSLRFSPEYPDSIPEFSDAGLILQNSQKQLYALDIDSHDIDLLAGEDTTLRLEEVGALIEKDERLTDLVSTFDRNDGMIRDGWEPGRKPLVTFAAVLKYDVFPLAEIIKDVLMIGEYGMGCPVELEFAVDLSPKRPIFSILQIRPFIVSKEKCEIRWEEYEDKEIFICSKRALGNGKFEDIEDIVYVSHDGFDSSMTKEIAEIIGRMNAKLSAEGRPYLLMGPGRWGTSDPWLGIPVRWSQISGVQILVETALPSFNVEPSQGTHFFNNLISKGVGYISVPLSDGFSKIDMEWLDEMPAVQEEGVVRHVRLCGQLSACLAGKQAEAVVVKPSDKKACERRG